MQVTMVAKVVVLRVMVGDCEGDSHHASPLPQPHIPDSHFWKSAGVMVETARPRALAISCSTRLHKLSAVSLSSRLCATGSILDEAHHGMAHCN